MCLYIKIYDVSYREKTAFLSACVTQHFGQARYGLSLAAVAAVQTLFNLIGNQLSPRLYSATVHVGHPEFTFYAATALGVIVWIAATLLPALDPRVPLAPGVAQEADDCAHEEREQADGIGRIQ